MDRTETFFAGGGPKSDFFDWLIVNYWIIEWLNDWMIEWLNDWTVFNLFCCFYTFLGRSEPKTRFFSYFSSISGLSGIKASFLAELGSSRVLWINWVKNSILITIPNENNRRKDHTTCHDLVNVLYILEFN